MPSFLPVIGVTILNIILGMMWYSPLIAGNMWVKAHKFEAKKLKATSAHYIGSLVVSLITALVLGSFINQFQIMTWRGGALLGICAWLGFVATTHFSGVIWAHKPFRVYLIDMGYQLFSLAMMGAILAAWL